MQVIHLACKERRVRSLLILEAPISTTQERLFPGKLGSSSIRYWAQLYSGKIKIGRAMENCI
jgi:hypothetical protein